MCELVLHALGEVKAAALVLSFVIRIDQSPPGVHLSLLEESPVVSENLLVARRMILQRRQYQKD